jgi:EAL domain
MQLTFNRRMRSDRPRHSGLPLVFFAGNCVGIAIKDAVSVGAPYGIHFYVEYRTVRRSNRLFNWGDGAINLAHALKLNTVAEGVETEEQLRQLRLLGCHEMQGYLFDKPMPVESFEQKYMSRSPSGRIL